MAFTNPPDSLTLPSGATTGTTRIVIGADTPAELQSFGINVALLFYVDKGGSELGYEFIGLSQSIDASQEAAVLIGECRYPGGGSPTSSNVKTFMQFDLFESNPGLNNFMETIFKDAQISIWQSVPAFVSLVGGFNGNSPTSNCFATPPASGIWQSTPSDPTTIQYHDGGIGCLNGQQAGGPHDFGIDRSGNTSFGLNTGTETDYSALGFAGVENPHRQYVFKGSLTATPSAAGGGVQIAIRKNTALTGTVVALANIAVPLITGAFEGSVSFEIPYFPNPGSNATAVTDYYFSYKAIGQNCSFYQLATAPNHCMMIDRGLFAI